MRKARDIKEQLEVLLERVEIELTNNDDPIAIAKALFIIILLLYYFLSSIILLYLYFLVFMRMFLRRF